MDITISNVGILAAVAAGAVSFLSPCVLPLVPGYVSFIAGNSARVRDQGAMPARLPAAVLSLCFIFGFSLVFVGLGASATALSRVLRAYTYEANLIGGTLVILFGIFTAGLLRPRWLERDVRFHGAIRGGTASGAFLLGLAFAFGWTPCIGPILGAILTVSAVSATAADGVTLLALYSLGLGLPFFGAAMVTQRFIARMPPMRRAGRVLQVAAGTIMILMGAAMVTGHMTTFAFWLLATFPAFGALG